MTSFAIAYEPSDYSADGKVMGRQSTGSALMQALADARLPQIACYGRSQAGAQACARQLAELGGARTQVSWIPYGQPERLAGPGLLYRPDPGIAESAWHRLTRAHPRAYSLCGVTHTMASHGPMGAFADYLTAPLESWDAVICTSRVARDAIRHVLEAQAAYLGSRLGATRFTLPQLPLIPLGVHARKFAASETERGAARQRLGLSSETVAFLFAGRLVVHAKAHPLPMYLALEQAAQGRDVVLIQAGQAPNPHILRIFTDESQRFCPSVRIIMVDGADALLYRAAWAAADVFTSLSDNLQETFGLTPIEAMSAGLPVVVSDWNGYKDTVRDGTDGFRVPTLTLPPGSGGALADRFDLGLDDYDHYIGFVSQLVAVDVAAAATAYRRLIDEPDLRARMGAAGQARAREVYDWSVVFKRYQILWEDLAERRRADTDCLPRGATQRRPDRADPFSMFASYPTHHVGPATRFGLRAGVVLEEALARRTLDSTVFALPVLPSPPLVTAILSALHGRWLSLEELTEAVPGARQEMLAAALVWLSKVGICDFEAPGRA